MNERTDDRDWALVGRLNLLSAGIESVDDAALSLQLGELTDAATSIALAQGALGDLYAALERRKGDTHD